MSYINVDAAGGVYTYDTEEQALDMSYRLPWKWRLIAFEAPVCNTCKEEYLPPSWNCVCTK